MAPRICSDDTLWTAVQTVVSTSRESRDRALGRYLKRQEGRIYNGLLVTADTDRKGVSQFQVRKVVPGTAG